MASSPSLVQRLKLKAQISWRSNTLALKGWKPNPEGNVGERILIYHGVAPSLLPGINSRFIEVQRFAEEMQWLHRNYQVVSLRQMAEDDYDKTTLAVGISFDDGYANNLRYAIPILQKLKLPATFFVTAIRGLGRDILWPDLVNLTATSGVSSITLRDEKYVRSGRNDFRHEASGESLLRKASATTQPGFISDLEMAFEEHAHFKRNQKWGDYWQQLREAEIRQISDEDRFEVGSHGGRHFNLAALPSAIAEEDLRFSRHWLEKTTGKSIGSIAYPMGEHSTALNTLARHVGYERIYVGDRRSEGDVAPDVHTRMGIHPKVNATLQMHYLNQGHY